MAVMMKQDLKQEQWNSVFPEFATIEGSCLFIKKLIAVSLSSITFMRGIFPERAYGNKDLQGLKLKILDESCGLKSVAKFIDLVRNCYEAVDKKYLQQMSIGIVPNPDNRDEIVELYNLVFQYRDDEYSISCQNKKNQISSKQQEAVKQATLLMLKNVYTISNLLETLPKNSYITMKLFYYDDITPPDYEPKGFSPCHKSSFEFVGETMKIQLGKVDTDNHCYKFYLKTALGNTATFTTQHSENSILNTSQNSIEDNSTVNEDPMDCTPSQASKSKKKVSVKDSTENILKCPCKCKAEDLTNTITCSGCNTKHHKVCYAILKPEDFPTVFYCVDCMLLNTDDDVNLDSVYTYSESERQKLCTMRRALSICLVIKTVGISMLEKKLGCTKEEASDLIDNLECEGFIKKLGKNKYSVDTNAINDFGFDAYFPTSEKENFDTTDLETDNLKDLKGLNDYNLESQNSLFGSNTSAKLRDGNLVESSINMVKSLSLNSMTNRMKSKLSQEKISTQDKPVNKSSSHKRKLSKALMSPENSEDLFQSRASKLKKPRTRGTH